jgi:hypothetical protein
MSTPAIRSSRRYGAHARHRVCRRTSPGRPGHALAVKPFAVDPAVGIISATDRETRTRRIHPGPVRLFARTHAREERSAYTLARGCNATEARRPATSCRDRPPCVVVVAPPTPRRAVDAAPPTTTSGRGSRPALRCLRAHVVPRGTTGTGKRGEPPVAASSFLVTQKPENAPTNSTSHLTAILGGNAASIYANHSIAMASVDIFASGQQLS